MQVSDTHSEPRYWRLRWVVLVPLAVAYWASLPHAVQTLDSGDMVTSAWGLTVAHAPGYPLYVWIYHTLMTVIAVGTPFSRAAFITSLCMLGSIALLLRLCRDWLGVFAAAAMATLTVVWRYAVLPDVFALHLLLSSALIVVCFTMTGPARIYVGAAVFGLAAANHHSILFLAPLLVLVALEEPSRLKASLALATGATLAAVLYASLMLLDVDHVNSFGDLSSLRGLLWHFLRRDYGTFSLNFVGGTANPGAVARDLVATFGTPGLAATMLVIAGVLTAVRARAPVSRPWWALLACLVIYFATFVPRLNLGGEDGHATLIRERFFLLPLLMLTALAVTAPVLAGSRLWLRRVLAGVLAVVALVQAATADLYDLRRDVVVEEYARNLLKTAVSQRTPAIVMVDSDTKLFALRYVQATERGYDDVFIVPRASVFANRFLAKAKQRWPALSYDPELLRSKKSLDIFAQFFVPNMEHFSIIHVMPFTSSRGRTTFYPLGRVLEAGSGGAIAEVPFIDPTPPAYRADSADFVDTKAMFAEYAYYHLARGKAVLEQGNKDGARRAFLDGLARVPYCIPCLRNACQLEVEESERCSAALSKLEETEYDYFR